MQNNKMLIGSRAAKVWFSDFREPKDTDYIIRGESCAISEKNTEKKQCWAFDKILDMFPEMEIAEPFLLYTLKLSHAYWDGIHWAKTMADIAFFQSRNVPFDEDIFDMLFKQWEEIKGPKRSSLNKSNEDFFKDNVRRKYVHDDLHYAIAYYEEPLYQRIKKNASKALTSKFLFDALSHQDKIKLAREEIYVTALERFLIPNDFRTNTQAAYLGALKMLITSMTRGFFARFLVENWLELRNRDNHDFCGKFKEALNNNLIKLCNSNK